MINGPVEGTAWALYRVDVYRRAAVVESARVEAWNRREAYWAVRNDMPAHDSFDAVFIEYRQPPSQQE